MCGCGLDCIGIQTTDDDQQLGQNESPPILWGWFSPGSAVGFDWIPIAEGVGRHEQAAQQGEEQRARSIGALCGEDGPAGG